MKQRIIAALVAIVVASIASQAQDNNGNRIVRDTTMKVEGRKYYSYWGVGFSQEQIPQIAAGSKDGVASDGVAKGSVNADLLGFYWPVGDPHMVIGIISNGALDANQLGIGLLLGLGYSIPIANGTTIMVGGTVNVRRVGTENYGGLGLTAGTLF